MSDKRGYIAHNKVNGDLVLAITGKPTLRRNPTRYLLVDGSTRHINGRYIVGNMPIVGDDGELVMLDEDTLATKRQRFRIPKGHPCRGERPRER